MLGTGTFLVIVGAVILVLIYGMRLRAQRNERLYSLYQQALEKGVDPREIQLELQSQEQGDPQGNLKAGIILLATSVAILLGLIVAVKLSGWLRLLGFVMVPAAIGLACIFIHFSLSKPTGDLPGNSGD